MSDHVSRRAMLLGLASVALAAGCTGEDSEPATAPPSSELRTIEHKYGSTAVRADPQRVVTLGVVDHDAVLALGIVPVALTAGEYSAAYRFGVWPWAQNRLGAATPQVLPDTEINFERVAALQPDLILAVYSGIERTEFDKLSKIAPTVAQSGGWGNYQTPWTEMTQTIGDALGRSAEAAAAIAGVEQKFAEARMAHPEFAGKTAVYAGVLDPGSYYVELAGSTRVGVLTELGFSSPTDIKGKDFYTPISQEQLGLIDRDVVLWELGSPSLQEAILDDRLYTRLDLHQEGREVFVTDKTDAGALALISVLSLPYIVDRLAPRLDAAVDGDPNTPVPD